MNKTRNALGFVWVAALLACSSEPEAGGVVTDTGSETSAAADTAATSDTGAAASDTASTGDTNATDSADGGPDCSAFSGPCAKLCALCPKCNGDGKGSPSKAQCEETLLKYAGNSIACSNAYTSMGDLCHGP